MNRSNFLISTAIGAVLGATVFSANPARSQIADIFDALSSISSQLGDKGILALILRQGFTQTSNYAKAQSAASAQIADAQNTAMARFHRDMRNAQIRDQHTVSSQACAHLDNGQTVIAGAGQVWKVSTTIQNVQDQRGEASQGMPAYFGKGQAIESLNQLHFQRYCSLDEANQGLCSVSQNQNGDIRASSLFGTGTLNGQDGVNAANDYVTHLVQPIVPAAIRGNQLISINGKEGAARRREYEARMSLARNVLNDAIAVQTPSVTLNTQQQTQLQNEGITAPTNNTGSELTAMTLDVHRRYSDIDWNSQLVAMTPTEVQREIARELAVLNFLQLENYKIALKHASVAAAELAATEERNIEPRETIEMPTTPVANN